MANRCPDCNKFVSLELADDPDVQSCEVEASEDGKTGLMRLTVHLIKICAECGTELAEKELELEVNVDLSGFEPTV